MNDLEQIIEAGIKKGIGVSWLVKENWDLNRLCLIYSSLVRGLSVDMFARIDLSFGQMLQCMYGVEQGLDVSAYNNPTIPERKMEEIRLGMLRDRKSKGGEDE